MDLELLWSKLKNLNINHFIFVCLCAVIAFLFRASDSYKLKPVWRKRVETHNYMNKEFPLAVDRIPPPIITDLEGDGVNEVILMTHDMKLTILALPNATSAEDDEDDKILPFVSVKHKVSLPLNEGNSWKSRPVAMTTGFTVPYESMMQIRKQIIVIATDDWNILCYSKDLELLWQQKLMDIGHVADSYKIKDMGLMITAHNVKKSDEGLIVVGGSFSHMAHKTENLSLNTTDSKAENENESLEEARLTHFSSFALHAKDGSVRWHHLPGDFGEPVTPVKDIHGDHHWKLALKRNRLHVGESPWKLYKFELFQFLPHIWTNMDDTKLTLGRFQKESDSSIESPETESRTRLALTPEHVIGYQYGGQRPHSDHEHVQKPNAVVINNHNGIEVLNLLTGRPITELKLPKDKSVYVDIDGDGNVEQLVWGQGEGDRPCHVDIWRFSPVKEKIDQLPVCRLQRVFFSSSWAYDEDMLQKVPPFVVKSVARKTGLVRYLLGHHLPKSQVEYDIITTGGMARVSSIDREGNVNWQLQGSYRWADVALEIRRQQTSNSGLYQEFVESFYPSRVQMSLQVSDKKNVLAIGGYKGFSLVNIETGKLLAEHSLPCLPTAPLVAGDFDNDGLNDIIVTCKLGYLGFTLHHHSNHIYTFMYAIAVFFAILLLSWFCSPEIYTDADDIDSDDLAADFDD